MTKDMGFLLQSLLCSKFELWASHVVLVVKTLPANAGDVRDMSLIPRLRRFPGGRNGNKFLAFRELAFWLERQTTKK